MADLYLGGSFNPIHRAHLTCSAAAAKAGGFGRVVFVPGGRPAQKDISEIAPTADRLAMVQRAIADWAAMRAQRAMDNGKPFDGAGAGTAVDLVVDFDADWAVEFTVDPIELAPDGPTYTFDTAAALRARGVSPVDWLIGADQVLNLHRWHRYPELLTAVRFWVMARPGYAIDWAAVDSAARSLASRVLAAPAMDVSATMIRQRIAAGLPVDEWLSPGVIAYIRDNSLYIPASRRDKLAGR